MLMSFTFTEAHVYARSKKWLRISELLKHEATVREKKWQLFL